MEWWLALLVVVIGLFLLLAAGIPVAFAFMTLNLIGVYMFMNGQAGLHQLIHSIISSVGKFQLLPIPLFILMGEVMFQSGIAPRMMDTLDQWIGRLPGRLGLLAVGGGTFFATLSGSGMASIAMMGTVLVPEMTKRGYKKAMIMGPILGSGGLAIMIPPSSFAVVTASLAEISIGGLLIAIIIPGLLMALLYAAYIIIRSWLQPSIAPPYSLPPVPLSVKLASFSRNILPLGFIIFLVTGFIFLGVSTPSEAAAVGACGCFILAAFYRSLTWDVVKKSVLGSARLAIMVFMIIAGSLAFSQLLALSGASRGLIQVVTGLPLPPIAIIIAMQLVLLVMGCVIDGLSILMISIPIFFPIICALGFDPIWFAVIMMLNIEMASTTPPFGLYMFIMKGLGPPGTTMGDVYRAGLPFLGCDAIVMLLMLVFPTMVLWLPSLMR